MYECPNNCDSPRFVQSIEQSKEVIVNESGEMVACQEVDEPSVSNPRCKTCGTEVEA